jgi:hypothetical protein
MGVYLHRTDAGGDWRGPVRPLQSTRPGGGATAAAADLDTRDAIYSDLFALCPPTPEHQALLGAPPHGLRADQVARFGYGSLPTDATARTHIANELARRHGRAAMLTTPGVVTDESGRLSIRGAGPIMATRDLHGRIVAIDVRRSVVTEERPNKYYKLSSRTDEIPDGPSPGTPAHWREPWELRDPTTIVLTEGIKKGDVAADLLGVRTLALAGVGCTDDAIAVLKELADGQCPPARIIVALDRDDPEKGEGAAKGRGVRDTEAARQRLAAAAHRLGYAVDIAWWDHREAKGVDDLLLAEGSYDLVRYRPDVDAASSTPSEESPAMAEMIRAQAETIRVQRDALQRAYAKIEDQDRAYDALERFGLTEGYTESEKKVLTWTLREKCGYRFGMPIPETFPTVRITDTDKPRAGLSGGSFDAARKRFVAESVFIESERPSGENSPTGRPYKVITVNGERLEHLIVGLNNDPGAQTEERLARAEARAQAARARHTKMVEERARREEQERITRQQLASIGGERRRFAEVEQRLSHQITEKEAEAQAMRQAAEDAQREAQRIIEQARRDSIPCGGCGTFIAIADWRCDDCRTEGTDKDRFTATDFSTGFVGNGYDDGQHRPAAVPHHLPSTTLIPTKLRENPTQAMGEDLKPCTGGCGTLTHRGWECKPCRERPPRPLHIPDSTSARPEVSHGH